MKHSAFAAWQLAIRSQAEFDQLGSEPASGARPEAVASDRPHPSQIRYLLEYSLLAPTSHNTVPQLYRIDEAAGAAELWLDRERILPASDPTGREALISIGCALENLHIAASAYGLALEWTPEPHLGRLPLGASAESRVLLGRARLRRADAPGAAPDDGEPRLRLRALIERRSIRSEYDPARPLPEHLLADIEAAAAQSPGVTLRLFTSPSERFNWGKLDELATKHKLEQRPFRTELGHWILPNDDRTAPRGMRGRELGLDDQRALELSAQLRGDEPLAADQLAMLARGGRVGMQSSAAVAALCAEDTVPLALELGRVFQRCALLAWRAGCAHAVHTAICEVPHVRSMCRATLLPGTPGPGLVFRLGVPLASADWDRPHASRPSLDDVLLPAAPSAALR